MGPKRSVGMANSEHLEGLLRGVTEWNAWRKEHPDIEPDLRGADLRGVNLWGVDLSSSNLDGCDLSGANLTDADLAQARIGEAKLQRANLTRASLNATHFIGSNLREAILDEAEIAGADFNRTTLIDSSFRAARLFQAVITDADLTGARGLETCEHEAPSVIDSRTLALSGDLPDAFLRGCGLPDWLIEAYSLMKPGLSNEEVVDITYRLCNKRIGQVVQLSPLFISYAHADAPFVDALERRLEVRGVRFWRDVRHATSGRLEKVIDRAIRLNPTVVVVLSETAVRSDWVEHEARVARQLEKELGRDVLCPLALDDSWKQCKWPARLREQIEEYNILDFSQWSDERAFDQVFERLLRGLSLFYDPEESVMPDPT